jgi:hypothetical protein
MYLSYILYVGHDNSISIATRYGLDGPGIESLPIPVAERSKAKFCGRSLAGIVVSNPAGVMDVRVVLYNQNKRQSQDNQAKAVQTKHRERRKECSV